MSINLIKFIKILLIVEFILLIDGQTSESHSGSRGHQAKFNSKLFRSRGRSSYRSSPFARRARFDNQQANYYGNTDTDDSLNDVDLLDTLSALRTSSLSPSLSVPGSVSSFSHSSALTNQQKPGHETFKHRTSLVQPSIDNDDGTRKLRLLNKEYIYGEPIDDVESTEKRAHQSELKSDSISYQKLRSEKINSANEHDPRVSAIHGDDQRKFSLFHSTSTFGDVYFVAIVAGCSAAAIFGVIGAGYCFYKFQQHNRATADVDYPAYGVVGPVNKESQASSSNCVSPSGTDRKLAQSAQMYHYHHQKQQMITSDKVVTSRHTSASDVDSDEENEEGDYTVYECPGLASTGEMEVKNPLFQDDLTPASSPQVNGVNQSKPAEK